MGKPIGYVTDADTGERIPVYPEDIVGPDEDDE